MVYVETCLYFWSKNVYRKELAFYLVVGPLSWNTSTQLFIFNSFITSASFDFFTNTRNIAGLLNASVFYILKITVLVAHDFASLL